MPGTEPTCPKELRQHPSAALVEAQGRADVTPEPLHHVILAPGDSHALEHPRGTGRAALPAPRLEHGGTPPVVRHLSGSLSTAAGSKLRAPTGSAGRPGPRVRWRDGS